MRQAKTDKYVCISMLVIFFYTFFIIGSSPIYCEELPYWGYNCRKDEVISVEWSLATIISPFVFVVFFCFMLFHRELEPVNRRWVKVQIKKGLRWTRWKMRHGIKEYKEWRVSLLDN